MINNQLINMIKQFKEIDDFFKKDIFNENDLINLKNLILSNYKDLNDIKLAYSVIELQLLKFEMLVNESKTNKQPLKKNTDRIKKSLKEHNKVNNKSKVNNEVIYQNEKLENTKNFNLLGILNQITETESKEKIINILKEKGVYKGRLNITLSLEDYNYVKDQLKILIKTNKEKDPTLRIKTNKNRSISKTNSVYDKIKSVKGVGKIIYIRSK